MGLRDGRKKDVQPMATQDSVSFSTAQPHQNDDVRDYGNKIDKVYAQMKTGDCFVEVIDDGFNLVTDDSGIGSTKIHFNFVKLNSRMKQEVFLPYYMDVSNFLALRYLLASGLIFTLEEQERNKGGKYLGAVFSEFKAPNNGKETKTFSVVPGMKKGNWMLNASYVHDGKTERVGVPINTGRLAAMCELIYLAYQKSLMTR